MQVLVRLQRFIAKPRNFVLTTCGCTAGVFMVKALPLVFPNYLYRPFTEAYKRGMRYCLEDSQIEEFQTVCKDLGVEPDGYNIYVTNRWEVKSSGLPWLPNGVHFAIPLVLKGDPNVANARFTFSSDLDSEEGAFFRKSLLLSEDARKFALAREVVQVEKNYPAYSVALAPLMVISTFGTSFVLQLISPILPLLGTVSIIGVAFFSLYKYTIGVFNERHDIKADDKVCNLGDNYIKGGLEFFERILQRNVALRTLLGSSGQSLYTYYGNETQGFLTSKGAPLTLRRDRVKHKLEQMEGPQ